MLNSRVRPGYPKGFTIIEMIMVIVIVGILTGLAIPRFQSFYYIKLNSAVKKVVSDIRYVQQLAVSRHDSYQISFNSGSNSYEARRVSDNSFVQDPFSRGNLTTRFDTDPLYNGIDIASANFGGSGNLVFNWTGAPQSGGTVSFSYQDNSMSLNVSSNTGMVRAQ